MRSATETNDDGDGGGDRAAPVDDVVHGSLTRDQARSRRKRAVRAHTENPRRTPRRLRVLSDEDVAALVEAESVRPLTRGECADGPRPCPYVDCRYHLMVDVMSNGSVKVNFPDLDVDQMDDTCALDVADRGGATLDRVGDLLNVTRERARQLEARALRRYRAFARGGLVELASGYDIDVDASSVDDRQDATKRCG